MHFTERFKIENRLGEGGMGVVYVAFDQRRGVRVALKTLPRLHPDHLFRLKSEFRSLAGVVHPNLVRLHDLFAEEDRWFFTMDLVDGQSFVDHVRVDPSTAFEQTIALDDELDTGETAMTPGGAAHGPNTGGIRERVLRDALRQLVSGVSALHSEGKLHRDLKPSNVLVGRDGRVVVLDFGLVSELGAPNETGVFGTPAFMAPEQARGEDLTPACDWYAVGVMLYQSLTGELPFEGTAREVVAAKQIADPVPPARRTAGVPVDLSELCMALLGRDPGTRAGARELLAVVGNAPVRPAPQASETVFVGRRFEAEQLEEAALSTRSGCSVVALVGGPSGIGKTTLVRRFLADRERAGAIVLRGRCHEREFIPFKALDGVVDDLGRYLSGLSGEVVERLLPPQMSALARLFPTLRRVAAIENHARETARTEGHAYRQEGFTALKQLLLRLTQQASLILFVDDAQWSDDDSAILLTELLGDPDPPPALIVAAHRDDTAPGPLLALFEQAPARRIEPAQRLVRVRLGALSPLEVTELAERLVDGTVDGAEVPRQIAEESGGSPYLAAELSRFARSRAGRTSGDSPVPVTLPEVILARIGELDTDGTQLLRFVALAGRPVEVGIAAAAARVSHRFEALDGLVAARLLRRVRPGEDEVTVYHDRVRDAVVRHLGDDAARGVLLSLAGSLEEHGTEEAEWLSDLYSRAGAPDRAGAFAVAAGDHAAAVLAFGRAAEHYQFALSTLRGSRDDERELYAKLGLALTNANRSADAADAYMAARNRAEGENALDLERMAAEHYLRAGRIEEGLRTFRNVLATAKITLPASNRAVLAALLVARARVRLRGLGYRLRDEAGVDRELMRRVHALRSAYPIGGVDPVRGALIMAQYCLVALDAGVPDHVMHVIVGEAIYAAVFGGEKGARTVESLRDEIGRLERLVDTPMARFRTKYFEAMSSLMLGRFRRCIEGAAGAEDREAPASAWELHDIVAKAFMCKLYVGDLAGIRQRLPALERHARERRDRHQLETLLALKATLQLAADQPEESLVTLSEFVQPSTPDDFSANYVLPSVTMAHTHLYTGADLRAFDVVRKQVRLFSRSGLPRLQMPRVFYRAQAASILLRAASLASQPPPGEAISMVKALEKEDLKWCFGFASYARACLLFSQRRHGPALEKLRDAAAFFDAAELVLYAASCRRQEGVVRGGEAGAALVAQADAELTSRGVAVPEKWARMYAPLPVPA